MMIHKFLPSQLLAFVLILITVQSAFAQTTDNFPFDGNTIGNTLTKSDYPGNDGNTDATNQTFNDRDECFFAGNHRMPVTLLTVEDSYDLSEGDISVSMEYYGTNDRYGNEMYFGLAPATTQDPTYQNDPFTTNGQNITQNEGFSIGVNERTNRVFTNNYRSSTEMKYHKGVNVVNTGHTVNAWHTLEIRFGLDGDKLIVRYIKIDDNAIPEMNNFHFTESNGGPESTTTMYPWLIGGSMRVGIFVDYYVRDLGVTSKETPLPILLDAFDVELNKAGDVNLKWSSQVEVNNDYYSIYKSTDAKSWDLLTRVQGVGNSSKKQTYQVVDNKPYRQTAYYKLTQTDYDGTTTNLGIRSIKEANTIKNSDLFAYPNPTKGYVKVRSRSLNKNHLRISNALGVDVTNLTKISSFNDNYLDINFKNLSNGIYFIHTDKSVVKIIKQ